VRRLETRAFNKNVSELIGFVNIIYWYDACVLGGKQIHQKENQLRAEKIVDLSKIVGALLCLVVSLVVVSPATRELTDKSEPYGVPFSKIAGESPSNFLQDFVFVAGSAVVIEGRYVVALYENAKKGLYAVAMFVANCDVEGCPMGDLIGFSIVDPSQSQQVFYTNLDRI
jgi:hypothetical protein